jgi:hypothetical protein
VLYAQSQQGHRIPRPRLTLTFSGGACGSSLYAVPVTLRSRVHPLVSFTPLQSPPLPTRPRPPGQEHLPWGSRLPLRGTSCRRRCDGVPSPPPIRPRRFSRPRRFDPPTASRVYFTPQPRPGFSLQGFVPPAQPYRLVTGPVCPLVVGAARLPAVAHRLHLKTPRPQGFAPCWNPRPMPQFYPWHQPVPFVGFPPPGSPSPCRRETSNRPASAHRLGSHLAFGVLPTRSPTELLRAPPTCSRFLPAVSELPLRSTRPAQFSLRSTSTANR